MNQMMTGTIDTVIELPKEVAPEIADDIEKESVFVSPHIERITVMACRSKANVQIKATADIDEVVDKATRYLNVMARQLTGFDIKVFGENVRRDEGEYATGVNKKLVELGWLHDYGKGQVAYKGPVLKLARLINETAGNLYEEHFNVADGHFPSFIDADTLHKCGYFDSHPNNVTFVGNVVEDFDALEEFRQANSCSEGALLPPSEHIHQDGMCLNPAACFPAYPTLSGQKIDEAGHVMSWLGRVFRYESRNICGLDRLYEFNVREIVFVGTDEYVRECRMKALPLVQQLAETFDLDMKLQTATDPFFATVSAAKKFYQQAQEVKNEILIPVLKEDGTKKDLACGSVNLHGNFFGQRFDIAGADDEPAHTGCIGLGIERWVLAGFTQHGFDPDRWPEAIRERIFD